jgi:two-component system chemotaxis response regulator CheY
LIEDDIPLQEAYGFILRASGHNVASALNGKEGLTQARKSVYDIILLDVHMPIMDGWDFLRAYQADKPDVTKIIVFSNMVEPDLERAAAELGADRSVLKSSMTPSSMLSLIRDLTD